MQSKYSTFMTKCHVKTAIVGYGGVERQSSKFYINKVRSYQATLLNRDDESRGGFRTKYLDPPWIQRWSSHVALSSRPGPIWSLQGHLLAHPCISYWFVSHARNTYILGPCSKSKSRDCASMIQRPSPGRLEDHDVSNMDPTRFACKVGKSNHFHIVI